MKAIIRLDVPDWQIGQEVHVYFRDTMEKKGVCEADKSDTVEYALNTLRKHGWKEDKTPGWMKQTE